MQRRTVSLVLATAMAGVCIGTVGIQGKVRAEPPDTKSEKSALPQSGWSKPKDGLQIGLFAQNGQKTFRYGDTIVLVMRARNISAAPIDVTGCKSILWY